MCLTCFRKVSIRTMENGSSKINGTSAQIDGKIKTVVVLVMENRSFDNMLGFLNRVHPAVDGLKGDEYNLMNVSDPNSEKVYISDNEPYRTSADPDHGFGAIREQVFGSSDSTANPPPMSGFAQRAEAVQQGFAPQVMSAFKPEAIPVTVALAKEFALFDRWFCSLPCSTQPNRFYVHSATSHGMISNVTWELLWGNPQKTIFENIEKAGLKWGIYFQSLPSTLFFSRLRKLKYIPNFLDYDVFFKRHAAMGILPNYTVIEQRYFDLPPLMPANDNHPPHDVSIGERFLKDVYETLRSSPQWNEMMWIITYDEHGGFYDHVPTPVTGIPNPDGIKGPSPDYFNFDRLGVRVPTIVVSPWVEKGLVVHRAEGPTPTSEYEHSSIPATVKKLFNLPNFLTWRDAWAGTFEGLFTKRDTPRTDCPDTLPDVPTTLLETTLSEECPVCFHTKTQKDKTTLYNCPLHFHTKHKEEKLSEWQEELLLLATVLKGDKAPPALKTVPEAHEYCTTAVSTHLNP